MPHQIDKTALVMHSAERMFHLVNDVASYPDFLPWCSASQVHEQTDHEIMASMDIAKGGIRHRLTTRNQLYLPHTIEMSLVDGPFRNLSGRWQFKPLQNNACKVILTLEFEFSGSLSRMTFGPVFNQAANTMVDAFCRRADQGTTAVEAVKRSGIVAIFPEVDPENGDMGIFGKVIKNPSAHELRDGDRVEVYRPLQIDPKQARLNRAKKKG